MKNIIISMFVFLCIPIWATNEENKQPTKIELAGELSTHNERSLIIPLEAFENDVTLTFIVYNEMGAANIIINSPNGIMHNQTLYLSPNDIETIDISNYTNGIYTLVITTSQSTNLTGIFEVK